MSEQERPSTASAKDKFDVLYKTLADYSDRFVGRFLSTLGFQLVVLGWLLTSESARNFFHSSRPGTIGTVAFAFMMGLSFPPSIGRVWKTHLRAAERLDKLGYMEKSFYELHVLPDWYPVLAIAIVELLYIMQAVMILHWHFGIL